MIIFFQFIAIWFKSNVYVWMEIYDEMIVQDMKYNMDIVIYRKENIILRYIRYVLNLRFAITRYPNFTVLLKSYIWRLWSDVRVDRNFYD